MPVCARCNEANPDRARFCLACGAPLVAETPSEAFVRKTVTALFCDVTSSVELGERLDPETLRRVMFRYFDEMRAVLERHGGTVEKFAGDAVMAVFGVPTANEDDALRAVRAADEMLDTLDVLNDELETAWGVRLAARIGINTGEVVVSESSGERTLATGDPVNLAARLQQAAEPGEILLGEETYRLVEHAIKAGPLEALSVKGKRKPVAPWRLEQVLTGAPRLLRQDSPLVGRRRERDLLEGIFDSVVDEQMSRLVTVLGPPGVGKSRLTEELGARLLRALVVRGRCLAYGEGITFWPVREMVRGVTDITDDDSPEVARAKIVRHLADQERADDVAAGVAAAIGLGHGAARAEETFWAIRKLFESVAARQPLVLVFEDVHWAEPMLLDLIEYLAAWVKGVPLMLLCLARPDLLDRRPSWAEERVEATIVPLEPLDVDETRELIVNLLGASSVDEDVVRVIAESAEGNPLFVEELLRTLVEEGSLRGENGRWAFAGEIPSVSAPPTINALLAARLDRLDPGERDLVQRASVVGKHFSWASAAALTPDEARASVGPRLQRLVRKRLLVPDEAARFAGEDLFRFGHILVRDAAYRSITKELRAELHERHADWIAQRAGEYEEIVGYHLEQAHNTRAELGLVDEKTRALARRGAEALAVAGRRAFERGDMPAAARLLLRATVLLRDDEAARIELAPDLSVALMETGELAQADGVLTHAIARARACGDRATEAHAEIVSVYLRFRVDPEGAGTDVMSVGERAIATFAELGDERGLAQAWRLLSFAHQKRARWGAGADFLEHALVHVERAADRAERATILNWLGVSLYFGPTPVTEAIWRCEQVLARASGDRALEASTRCFLAGLNAMLGRFDEARRLVAASKAVFEDLGVARWIAAARAYAADVELLAGDPRAAAEELRSAYDVHILTGDKADALEAGYLLAHALCAQGHFTEAEQLVATRAKTIARSDLLTQVVGMTAEAKVLASRGRFAEAEAAVREAVDVADATDGLNMRAAAWLALGEVLQGSGRTADARAAIETAVRLYEQKGNLAAARDAHARVAMAAATA